jgi:protein-S-isoprenylcysteine O-methyltransferase Ste14
MKGSYAAWASRWRVPLGFAFAIAYLIISRPSWPLLISGLPIAFLGLAIRAWAAGYIEKGRRLATGGPFAFTRNPLYLGSLLLGAGFVVAGGSWILGVIFVALFLMIYIPVMRREEAFLRQRFGAMFDLYAKCVPPLVPVLPRSFHGEGRFAWRRYRNNREYNAAIGYAALVVFLVVKLMLR